MKFEIELKCDEPTKNRRHYPKYLFKKALQDYNKQPMRFGEIGDDTNRIEINVNLSNVSHRINKLWLKENILMAEINFLENKKGMFLFDNMDDFKFYPHGIGRVDEDGIVSDYKLIAINAIIKENLIKSPCNEI